MAGRKKVQKTRLIEKDFPLTVFGRRLDIPNEAQRQRVMAYIMIDQMGVSVAEGMEFFNCDRRALAILRHKGFEILTISRYAEYVLHLDDEKLCRALYKAGYKTIAEIRYAITSGEITVSHERHGNHGSIPGIGRRRLAKLKALCGLSVEDSNRGFGIKSHWRTGQPKVQQPSDEQRRQALERVQVYRLGHKYKITQKILLRNLTFMFTSKFNRHSTEKFVEFTSSQAAKILQVTNDHMRDLLMSGEIQRNQNNLIPRSELIRWGSLRLNGWAIRSRLSADGEVDIDLYSSARPGWAYQGTKPLGEDVE